MHIYKKTAFRLIFCYLFFSGNFFVLAQIPAGVYFAEETKETSIVKHQLTVSDNYIIHSAYHVNPPIFVETWGGFYEMTGNSVTITLEFNSNYDDDGVKSRLVQIEMMDDTLKFGSPGLSYKKSKPMSQALDGHWLFATRGPDTGQERRGDDQARKTLKVLVDGTFQWIAYNTENFKFFGTGGGSYTAKDGVYTENIEFFSRDNSRVGAELQFKYEVDGNDWHHTGKNSRGEPLYEIWSKR